MRATKAPQGGPARAALFLCLLLAGPLRAVTVVRGPYLQLPGPSSMWLHWRTDAPTYNQVRYGTAPGSLNITLTTSATGGGWTEHREALGTLSPDTVYWYAVGDIGTDLSGPSAQHWFRTAPLPGTRRHYRFWAFGDGGTGSSVQTAVRDAYAALSASSGVATDLWLQLGDNAYPNGTDAQYQANNFDVYADFYRNVPMMPCIGNHEGAGADYYAAFDLPSSGLGGVPSGTEAWYSYDYGNVHFVVLDSWNADRGRNGPMGTWLAQDLAANSLDWTIAYFHHPPYTKGTHDSDDEAELIQMREGILPLLEAGGVDLVLSGHSHAYERSGYLAGHYGYSWDFNGQLSSLGGQRVQAGPGSPAPYLDRGGPYAGTVYVVAGSGGQVGEPGGGIGPLDHPAMERSLAVAGSLVIDVDGDSLSAVFLDAAGLTRDAFSILRAPGSPAPTPVPAPEVPAAPRYSCPRRGSPLLVEAPQSFRSACLRLYNSAGEAVLRQCPGGAGRRLSVESGSLAPGIYWAELRWTPLEGAERRVLSKVAILP